MAARRTNLARCRPALAHFGARGRPASRASRVRARERPEECSMSWAIAQATQSGSLRGPCNCVARQAAKALEQSRWRKTIEFGCQGGDRNRMPLDAGARPAELRPTGSSSSVRSLGVGAIQSCCRSRPRGTECQRQHALRAACRKEPPERTPQRHPTNPCETCPPLPMSAHAPPPRCHRWQARTRGCRCAARIVCNATAPPASTTQQARDGATMSRTRRRSPLPTRGSARQHARNRSDVRG